VVHGVQKTGGHTTTEGHASCDVTSVLGHGFMSGHRNVGFKALIFFSVVSCHIVLCKSAVETHILYV
jgi:hypothetical protein